MKIEDIQISYDGSFPNLCSGDLVVYLEKQKWVFPAHCLSSGGSVSFDSDYSETITQGEWSINEWPENFPEEMKDLVSEKVNDEISHGCCGGCV